jgi:hypothetical protein
VRSSGVAPAPGNVAKKRKTAYEKKRDASKIPRTSSKLNTPKVKQERYVPLRNKTRQYKDTQTGAIISRRQYTKAVYTGGQSLERRAKGLRARGVRSHLARYQTLLKERQSFLSRAGVKATPGEIRASKEMQQIVKDLRSREGEFKKGKNTLYRADSRKARALVQLGLRDPNWTMPVGESPK